MKYTTDPLRNPLVVTAIRLVFTDKVTCVMAGYKQTRYQLTTKQLVAKVVVDKLITQAAMAKACGLYTFYEDGRYKQKQVKAFSSIINWIADYKSGALRLENSCSVRRV